MVSVHSFVPFPWGYVTLGEQRIFSRTWKKPDYVMGPFKLEACRGDLLFEDNHHPFSCLTTYFKIIRASLLPPLFSLVLALPALEQ